MGNQQGQDINDTFTKLMARHTQLAPKQDHFFGQITLYKNKLDDSKIMVKSFNCYTIEEYKDIIKCLKQRRTIKHPNLVPIWAINNKDESNFCSDNRTVQVALEYFDDSIDRELEIRTESNARYQEIYLWIFLQQIVDVLSYLQEQELCHGDIRPVNIYLDSQGSAIIADHGIIPYLHSSYIKALSGPDEELYLAPELLANLNLKNQNFTYNKYKADVFSLGMTLLEVATLYKSSDCYDYQTYEINMNTIAERINQMRQVGYSQILTNLVNDLLQFEVNRRPDFYYLQDFLSKYKISINNMENFWDTPHTLLPFQQINTESQNKLIIPQYNPQMQQQPLTQIIYNQGSQNFQQQQYPQYQLTNQILR